MVVHASANFKHILNAYRSSITKMIICNSFAIPITLYLLILIIIVTIIIFRLSKLCPTIITDPDSNFYTCFFVNLRKNTSTNSGYNIIVAFICYILLFTVEVHFVDIFGSHPTMSIIPKRVEQRS